MAAININRDQFNEMIKGGKPLLVEYSARWCLYCRRLEAVYDRIAEEYKDRLSAVKLDIDREPELSELEQIEVIPTLVLYKDGKALDSIVVPDSKAMIDDFLSRALA